MNVLQIIYEGAEYYPSANGFGEIDIFCAHAPDNAVDEYAAILESNR